MENNIGGRESVQAKTTFGTEYTVKKWLNKEESRKLYKFLSPHSVVGSDGKVQLNIKSIDAMIDFYDVLVQLYVITIGVDMGTDVMKSFNSLREQDAQQIQEFVSDIYHQSQKKTMSGQTSTGITSTPETGQ